MHFDIRSANLALRAITTHIKSPAAGSQWWLRLSSAVEVDVNFDCRVELGLSERTCRRRCSGEYERMR